VKFNVHLSFYFYLIDVHISLTPPHPQSLTESCLCIVILEAPENAQSHVTFLALQLPFNFIVFQTTFHCHCMMNETTIFLSTMNTQKTECTLYPSHDACVWLWPYKEHYSLAAAMEGLGTNVQNKDFSL
jgi:hypothetical protein